MVLLCFIEFYIDNLCDVYVDVWFDQVEVYFDCIYFVWIGGEGDDVVYYYCIYSLVIFIEFDY